jgi:hypothetical protein
VQEAEEPAPEGKKTPPLPQKPAVEEVQAIALYIKRAASRMENGERAKAGGILLEGAEWLETTAGKYKSIVAREVAALQDSALEAARGGFPKQKLATIAPNCTIRLALIESLRCRENWDSGNTKVAGSAWRSALTHLQKAIDEMEFGLKDAGLETLEQSKRLAASMAAGERMEMELAIKQNRLTNKMIHEVGRNLAESTSQPWQYEGGQTPATGVKPSAASPAEPAPAAAPAAPQSLFSRLREATKPKGSSPGAQTRQEMPKTNTAQNEKAAERKTKGQELQRAIQDLEKGL